MDTMATEPAIVQGNEAEALAVFVEDINGDLCDIEFYCEFHGAADKRAAALPWPAYSFSPDYDTNCHYCGRLINRAA